MALRACIETSNRVCEGKCGKTPALVLLAEVITTALESVVDRFGEEHHPLAGLAKDQGSAAVFVTLSTVAMIWLPSLWIFVFG